MATLAHDELIWVACPARVWRAARVLSTGDDVLSVERLSMERLFVPPPSRVERAEWG